MITIGQKIAHNDGVGAGFDALRVYLSIAVILWHCVALTAGSTDKALATPIWPLVYSIIPLFFALSGFLVTGSAMRLTLGKFAASRILRIVPALAVDTLVTILILAPLVTTLPVAEFFVREDTWEYLLNIVGEIRYTLPGVFETNPFKGVVNGSLWTIRPELACYLLMFIFIATSLVKRWPFIALATAVSFMAYAFLTVNIQGVIPEGLIAQKGLQKLVAFFFFGALAFHLRERIPYSPILLAISIAAIVFGMVSGNGAWVDEPAWVIASSPFLVYIMVFLGVTRVPLIPFFHRGDYSYGIYLYGFPIQQTIVLFTGTRSVISLFAMSMPFIIGFAMLSWHLVEKPTLKLRKGFSMAAKMEAKRQSDA